MFRRNASADPAKSTWTEWSTTRSTGTRGSMIFGSLPSSFTALRIAARSTTSGTPVKSWRTIRATTKGISSFAGDFAFHFASVSTSLRRTFFPSQFRSTDSSTIRMLTGNREIGPTPCSSSAGKENNKPSRPFPASNFFSVLNSSFIFLSQRTQRNTKGLILCDLCGLRVRSFQLRQLRFDLVEMGQLAGVVIAFGVLDYAVAIDDESGALRHAAH